MHTLLKCLLMRYCIYPRYFRPYTPSNYFGSPKIINKWVSFYLKIYFKKSAQFNFFFQLSIHFPYDSLSSANFGDSLLRITFSSLWRISIEILQMKSDENNKDAYL